MDITAQELSITEGVKYAFFMTDMPVPAVNVLCELHQIIGKAEKSYDQLEMDNNEYRVWQFILREVPSFDGNDNYHFESILLIHTKK